MQDFRRLRVSTRARELIKAVYLFTRELPKEELFGVTSQMRRASISVGLNIAEGCSRPGTRELLRFLTFSVGSVMELDFALVVCGDLAYGDSRKRDELASLVITTRRELLALMRT